MHILKTDKKSLSFCIFTAVLPAVFAFVTVLFFAFDQSMLSTDQRVFSADIISVTAVALSCFGAFFAYKQGKLNPQFVVILLVVIGFFMRLSYITEYGYYQHQHDVESLKSSGHLSYIYNLSIGNGLPETNAWQYSHPPFYHILAAAVVKLSTACGFSFDRAFENVQLLTLMFSFLILAVSVALFEELKLRGKALISAVALVSLHPTFFIFAGSINNDCLMMLLSLCAVLFLVKWWNRPTLCNALLIGLFLGLGMMTKFSVALLAAVTAVVVIVKLLSDKTYKFGKFLLQTTAFLAVVLPMGLWYQIRNSVIFDQPLGYIAPIPETSDLFIGNISFAERILLPFPTQPIDIHVDVWEEYNLFSYVLRNSMFGEYAIGNKVYALFLVIFNLVVVLLSVLGVVSVFKKGRTLLTDADWIIVLVLTVQVAFFVYFNASYPFGCTMDYRYIPLTAVCSACLLGKIVGNESEGVFSRVLARLSEVTVFGFCIFSVLTYI